MMAAPTWRVLIGDVREQLATLPDASVQCVVTSPPYYGLRNYGVDGQVGLEKTFREYITALLCVFAEVHRVLSDDGTLWLNLGDTYASGKGTCYNPGGNTSSFNVHLKEQNVHPLDRGNKSTLAEVGLKPKDLIGVPWAVAFAMRDAGWYLRSDIIWAKPNPMPESVTDRPTKAHEYIFLMSKNERYYFDQDAVREPHVRMWDDTNGGSWAYGKGDAQRVAERGKAGTHSGQYPVPNPLGANCRTVWTFATQPYPEAHFATFPEALPERCIKAGSRGPGKRCDCDELIATPLGEDRIEDPTLLIGRAGFNRPRLPGQGTRPITRREQRAYAEQLRLSPFRVEMAAAAGQAFEHYLRTDIGGARPIPPKLLEAWLSTGWLATPAPCTCPIEASDIVLDPFCGSGTTGQVAIQLGRSFIGIELNPQYAELARKRIGNAAPLFAAEAVP